VEQQNCSERHTLWKSGMAMSGSLADLVAVWMRIDGTADGPRGAATTRSSTIKN
jgi:hypothetical protein